MIYVALLRGINVGGNSIVSMAKLKTVFEELGYEDVKTYINSGNVIFRSSLSAKILTEQQEKAIHKNFDLPVKVLIKSLPQLQKIETELPDKWANDKAMKCDVMFLWEDVRDLSEIKKWEFQKAHEDVKYLDGAILWRVDRDFTAKSKMLNVIRSPIYKQMTVRNCNTFRKILQMMTELSAS